MKCANSPSARGPLETAQLYYRSTIAEAWGTHVPRVFHPHCPLREFNFLPSRSCTINFNTTITVRSESYSSDLRSPALLLASRQAVEVVGSTCQQESLLKSELPMGRCQTKCFCGGETLGPSSSVWHFRTRPVFLFRDLNSMKFARIPEITLTLCKSLI